MAGVDADHETMESIANAGVRDVEFVVGSVSMDTLPSELPEACFAGRSNVGKSSLVNMLTNRKKLAFTSKTPGKTQQFNYFLVNGNDDTRVAVPDGDPQGVPAHQFYLVPTSPVPSYPTARCRAAPQRGLSAPGAGRSSWCRVR